MPCSRGGEKSKGRQRKSLLVASRNPFQPCCCTASWAYSLQEGRKRQQEGVAPNRSRRARAGFGSRRGAGLSLRWHSSMQGLASASRDARLASSQCLFQVLAHRGEVGIEACFASDQNDTARGRAWRGLEKVWEKALVQQGTQASFGAVARDRIADLAACRDAQNHAVARAVGRAVGAPREVGGGIGQALDDEEGGCDSARSARGLYKLYPTQHANSFRQHGGGGQCVRRERPRARRAFKMRRPALLAIRAKKP